jgi:hypothetical protein
MRTSARAVAARRAGSQPTLDADPGPFELGLLVETGAFTHVECGGTRVLGPPISGPADQCPPAPGATRGMSVSAGIRCGRGASRLACGRATELGEAVRRPSAIRGCARCPRLIHRRRTTTVDGLTSLYRFGILSAPCPRRTCSK